MAPALLAALIWTEKSEAVSVVKVLSLTTFTPWAEASALKVSRMPWE